ncbi:MAG: 16S rRNA (guanine(966)-N(2))-methyltransferase RsmD [Dethiobacter sp.]|jgi:16S rRNA (guanine(966)-N(2))-methyltransferase RsmD|nr:16S rRNA (guanine(966)-N(2))-methyltransferase RsmD [Dethiobacter sp.]MBS3982442.1 16S rRNA (guanine(966)-N(2))-methyltransferase RsmD [Dethiobacter sp.]MCL4463195.1 16S rRNA (guanine(966)-N(2))-methyltransferase RsmD [Bacillota bacterium]MCL5994284.1 16S rRNA (guanine(966)-N(2))-methyltransferase RsmD [Bacillota bacterium]
MRIIAGCARGRRLKTRKGQETRPTADRIKEALFNILASRVVDCSFLDVFAGSGGIGIEALSRGAQSCVFIEKSSLCAKIIKENLSLAGLAERAVMLTMDAAAALTYLCTKAASFNLIFFDPPYFSDELEHALQVAVPLLLPGGLIVVEHHSRDHCWYNADHWTKLREKTYGNTTLSFIVPVAFAADACLPKEEGG